MTPHGKHRQRSAEHPMVLFFLVVAAAFAAMALVPPTGAAFAFLGSSPAVSASSPGSETPDASGSALSEAAIACHGQAWGAESSQCLAVIGKEGGVSRAVRVSSRYRTGSGNSMPGRHVWMLIGYCETNTSSLVLLRVGPSRKV